MPKLSLSSSSLATFCKLCIFAVVVIRQDRFGTRFDCHILALASFYNYLQFISGRETNKVPLSHESIAMANRLEQQFSEGSRKRQ